MSNPQFAATWKAPEKCLACGKGQYLMVDGTDVDQGGEQHIKNVLGISIQPNRWRYLRCNNADCHNVQLFRLPG